MYFKLWNRYYFIFNLNNILSLHLLLASLLSFLFLEDETIHAEKYSMQFSITLIGICIIISGYLAIQIRTNLTHLEPLQAIVRPIYVINFVLVFRYIILLVDFIIWYYTDGKQSLNDFYQIILWLVVVNESRKILQNQDLIQINQVRNPILNQLLIRFKIIIVFAFTFSFISSFIFASIIFEVIAYVFFSLGVYLLYKRFKEEQSATQSKLVKLRWDYYSWAWLLALVYVFITAMLNGLIFILYNDVIDGRFFVSFQVFNNLIPLGISLNFYWFVFIPERGRRRYSLINPKEFVD